MCVDGLTSLPFSRQVLKSVQNKSHNVSHVAEIAIAAVNESLLPDQHQAVNNGEQHVRPLPSQ